MKVKDMTFKMGQELKVRVRPDDDSERFAINIGHDPENIAMHFNPRFDYGGAENIIVCNSMSGGSWGEEQRDSFFPFVRGEECKFYINFNNEQFYIKLPDGTMMNFPNRLGDVKYQFFEVTGGARIVGIKIK
ncbi:lectin, galactoside-binding, soluble, 2b [Cyprinodon tularosa]|uniref:Galectin n=2 Tax=Cyprinodon variegatus TaxID=28743 RepID=A0A3Q2CVC3_CYPVA|nr:PREDICTED: beta-galactoside-binding lectin-like [Cyprinodon variegatus]XP_038146533.1 lectin, galactoside-binding, soluble, 2b [Cyprinodon tularosa]